MQTFQMHIKVTIIETIVTHGAAQTQCIQSTLHTLCQKSSESIFHVRLFGTNTDTYVAGEER